MVNIDIDSQIPVEMVQGIQHRFQPRPLSLALAVVHHGLANFASKSVPANKNTILETAQAFEVWLAGENVVSNRK